MRRDARFAFLAALAILVLCLTSPVSRAQTMRFGVGVQPIGFSIEPDQYVFGVQSILGRLQAFQFAPSIDFGFGDDLQTITINTHLLYDLFSPPETRAVFYIGAGPAFFLPKPDGRDRNTEVGVNLLGGIKVPFRDQSHYYNLEFRYGIDDVPDFKLLMGVMFAIDTARDR